MARGHEITKGYTHGEPVFRALNQDVRPDKHTWTYGDNRTGYFVQEQRWTMSFWKSGLSFAVCAGDLLLGDETPSRPGRPAARSSRERGLWGVALLDAGIREGRSKSGAGTHGLSSSPSTLL